jgi:hypothetical protein
MKPYGHKRKDTTETAVSRINDMLESDDGQAHKEARKFIESPPAPEGEKPC